MLSEAKPFRHFECKSVGIGKNCSLLRTKHAHTQRESQIKLERSEGYTLNTENVPSFGAAKENFLGNFPTNRFKAC